MQEKAASSREVGGATIRRVEYYYATVKDRPSFCFDITGFVEKKIESIVAYETQFVVPENNRRIVDWMRASALFFGSRIGTEAAEPFFTREPLGLGELTGLSM